MDRQTLLLGTKTARAAFLAALVAAAVLAPVFWIIGVLHFGAITGPDPTTRLMISNVIWTSLAGIPVLAYILRRYVRERALRTVGYGRACVIAAAALLPIQ